jgi:hypothetical protein
VRDAAVAGVVAVVSVDDLGPVPRDGRGCPAAHTASWTRCGTPFEMPCLLGRAFSLGCRAVEEQHEPVSRIVLRIGRFEGRTRDNAHGAQLRVLDDLGRDFGGEHQVARGSARAVRERVGAAPPTGKATTSPGASSRSPASVRRVGLPDTSGIGQVTQYAMVYPNVWPL